MYTNICNNLVETDEFQKLTQEKQKIRIAVCMEKKHNFMLKTKF